MLSCTWSVPRALASRRCPARRPRVELERAATLRPWNADSASRPPRQCDGMQTLPCGGQSEAPLLKASASTTSKRARARREASSLKAVSTQRARVPSPLAMMPRRRRCIPRPQRRGMSKLNARPARRAAAGLAKARGRLGVPKTIRSAARFWRDQRARRARTLGRNTGSASAARACPRTGAARSAGRSDQLQLNPLEM